jgi:transcriptional repressor NrdR
MKCPSCGFPDSKVIDSRPVADGSSIRRRRECLQCQKRFTTFEVIESVQIVVIKKDGSKELFDRNKLLSGVLKACQKRPVNAEEIVNEIETELQNSLRLEVPSREIGTMVMDKLKARDEVAYVRFASVYREFRDVDTFLRELNELKIKTGNEPGADYKDTKK